jgi:hypothetical protein
LPPLPQCITVRAVNQTMRALVLSVAAIISIAHSGEREDFLRAEHEIIAHYNLWREHFPGALKLRDGDSLKRYFETSLFDVARDKSLTIDSWNEISGHLGFSEKVFQQEEFAELCRKGRERLSKFKELMRSKDFPDLVLRGINLSKPSEIGNEEIFKLIELSPTGKKLLQKFRHDYSAGKISITWVSSPGDLPVEAAKYSGAGCFNYSDDGGEISIYKGDRPLGVIAYALTHEIAHAVYYEGRPRMDELAREYDKVEKEYQAMLYDRAPSDTVFADLAAYKNLFTTVHYADERQAYNMTAAIFFELEEFAPGISDLAYSMGLSYLSDEALVYSYNFEEDVVDQSTGLYQALRRERYKIDK